MRTSDMFPSKYLKAEDAKAKPIIATISYVEMERIGQGSDQKEKPIMYFQDFDKPMVLNKTNAETLEDAFGDTDTWSGNKIKIRCARTQYAGKSVDGLRVEAVESESKT
jgi:hypothetical protein